MTKLNSKKLLSLSELKQKLIEYRKNNTSIVFTNGCFDVIHAGHIHYLSQASSHGDIFILGLNSDSSVKRLKGDQRPIHTDIARAYVLSALSVVDWIVIFDEDTPISLIETIQPDTHVKGGDYIAENLPEFSTINSYGGKIIIEPFIDGYSTTSILKKLEP